MRDKGRTVRIDIPNGRGQLCRAVFRAPVDGSEVVAVIVHAFHAQLDGGAGAFLAESLAEAGIASVRFRYTIDPGPARIVAPLQFSTQIEELLAVARYVRTNLGRPQLLVGHSLDGVSVLAASQHLPETHAIATIGVPADPARVAYLHDVTHASYNDPGDDLVYDALLSHQLVHVKTPYLILHAPEDVHVKIQNALSLFRAAQFPKAFVSLDGCDHYLENRSNARHAGHLIATWARRFLTPVTQPVT